MILQKLKKLFKRIHQIRIIIIFTATQLIPSAIAQNDIDSVEVFLLGTAHYFDPAYKQDFQQDIDIIAQFNPDLVCAEVIPSYDTISLKSVRWHNMKKADSIRTASNLSFQKIDSMISKLSDSLETDRASAMLFEHLAWLYFLKYDFLGNSDYYWFQADIWSKEKTINEQFGQKRCLNLLRIEQKIVNIPM